MERGRECEVCYLPHAHTPTRADPSLRKFSHYSTRLAHDDDYFRYPLIAQPLNVIRKNRPRSKKRRNTRHQGLVYIHIFFLSFSSLLPSISYPCDMVGGQSSKRQAHVTRVGRNAMPFPRLTPPSSLRKGDIKGPLSILRGATRPQPAHQRRRTESRTGKEEAGERRSGGGLHRPSRQPRDH